MNYQKLPFIRRFLVLLLCDELLFFKPVSYPYGLRGRDDEYTSSTTIGPTYVEILASEIDNTLCASLKKCPDTEKLISNRQMCFPPPSPGYIYHCGFDSDTQKYVDFYLQPFKCNKGTYGAPTVNGSFVTLTCKDCPKDRFNPQDRYSPASMDECRSHYHKPVSLQMHVIKFLLGNKTDPAVYYCDHKKSWISTDQTLFCRHSYKPCKCEYKDGICQGGGELLPDGRCVPKCAEERLPENNFDCVIQVTHRRLTPRESLAHVPVLPTDLPRIPENKIESQKPNDLSQTTHGLSTISLVIISVCSILVGVAVFLCSIFILRNKCDTVGCVILHSSTTIGRDNFTIQATETNINQSASHAELSSSGDSHAEGALCNSYDTEADDDVVDEQQIKLLNEVCDSAS